MSANLCYISAGCVYLENVSQHVSHYNVNGDNVSVLCSQLVSAAHKWQENLSLQV